MFVRVLPNVADFAKSLDRYLKRVEARTVLRIRTEIDGEQLVAQVRDAARRAQAVTIDVPTSVHTAGMVGEVRRAAAVAERSTSIDVPVTADTRRLSAALAGLGALAGKGRGALGFLAQGSKLAVGAAALAGMVTQAVHLVAALAPAAGALGAIPALAVTGAAALVTLKLAFSGVGDALAGDPEALAKLAPSARAFVGELLRARPALDALKAGVQQAVFGPLSVEVQGLVRTWLPLLSRHLASIGGEFGLVFGQFAKGAQTPEFIRGIVAALDAATVGVHGWGAAAIPIMQAVGNIVGAFAPAIGRVGSGLADAARQAAEFVNAAAESGKLAEFVGQVGATLRQIGGILLQVGGILGAVFSAAQASGGGLLNNLEQILTAVNQFLSAGAGQTALIDFFASASGIIRTLLPIVTTLAAGFGSVLAPALLKVAGLLGPGLQAAASAIVGIVKSLVDSGALDALASGLSDGLAALGPALIPLAGALGSIVRAAAPLLPLVGKIAAVLAGVLGSALQSLEPLVTAVVDALSESGLADVLAEIGAELGPLIAALVADLMPTVRALLPLLGPLLMAAGKIIVMVLAAATSLLTLLRPLHEFMAAKVLVPVVEALAKGLVWLAGAADKGAQGWRLLTAWLQDLDWSLVWDAIVTGGKAALSWLLALPGRALAALAGLPSQLAGWALGLFVDFSLWVADGIASVLVWWSSLPGRALAAVSSLRDRAAAFLAEVWVRANAAVSAGVDQAVAFVRSLPGRAADALSSLGSRVLGVFSGAGSWLVNAGRDIIAGLINGINSMVERLKSRLRAITDLLPDWKGPAAVDRRILAPSGRLIMAGLIDGITGQVPALRSELAGITADIGRDFTLGVNAAGPSLALPELPAPRPAYGLGTAGPVTPIEPTVNVVAEVRIGDGPVIDAVETAVRRAPERFASHVRAGERGLQRRG
ncbi:hypothetical protein [Longispora fulva]|uniref:Phage-related protein n=1 Tax=Longispora fulva TaxID=619741 RepID=A0A8J7GHB7_9ACTN|nr:hypothetical protein [Longispora fulva]MBG6140688.1 hypothetical protein [Longispora fulva]